MRIPDLRRKIIINCTVSVLLVLGLAAVINFYLNQETNVQDKVTKINNEISRIKMETAALESKSAEVKKYTSVWQSMSEKKTMTGGIKVDDFNAKLSAVADKYNISNVELKISLPEAVNEGPLKRESLDILLSTVNISFSAFSDVKALSFINEFLASLQGYPVVTAFEMKKTKDYSDQDFQDIASGKGVAVVTGKIDFNWYVFKENASPIEEPTVKNNNEKTR